MQPPSPAHTSLLAENAALCRQLACAQSRMQVIMAQHQLELERLQQQVHHLQQQLQCQRCQNAWLHTKVHLLQAALGTPPAT